MCILGVFIFEISLFLYYVLFVCGLICICFVPYIVPLCVPPFRIFDILSKNSNVHFRVNPSFFKSLLNGV